MKYDEVNENSKVVDTWFGDYGVGVVNKKLKTVIYITFSNMGLIKYDKKHAELFLKLI